MSSQQKNPTAPLLRAMARAQAQFEIDRLPKSHPATVKAIDGAFVIAQIEVEGSGPYPLVRVPIANSRYVREPLQVGEWGHLEPCDYPFGKACGTDNVQPVEDNYALNLESFVFQPTGYEQKRLDGKEGFPAFPAVDPDALVISGNKRVIIQNATAKPTATIVVDDKAVTITTADASFTINSANGLIELKSKSPIVIPGDLTVKGNLEVDGTVNMPGDVITKGGVSLQNHTHTTSMGPTGTPIPDATPTPNPSEGGNTPPQEPMEWPAPQYNEANMSNDRYKARYPNGAPVNPPTGGRKPYSYGLKNNPPGMTIDEKSGALAWNYESALGDKGEPPQSMQGAVSIIATSAPYTAESLKPIWGNGVFLDCYNATAQSGFFFATVKVEPTFGKAPYTFEAGILPEFEDALPTGPGNFLLDKKTGRFTFEAQNSDEGPKDNATMTNVATVVATDSTGLTASLAFKIVNGQWENG